MTTPRQFTTIYASFGLTLLVLLLLLIPSNKRDRLTGDQSSKVDQTINKEQQSARAPIVLMSTQPQLFVKTVGDCLFSSQKNCSLSYLHIQKTGGSHVASRLFELSPHQAEKYESKDWCCFDKLYRKFHNSTQQYCHLPVASYEVNPLQFGDIVDTCTSAERRKQVAFVTVRDPILQTLSMIHHQCNKNYDKKNFTTQQICRRCRYNSNQTNDDQLYWNSFVDHTNTIYLQLRELIMMPGVPLLIIDNAYIDWFFEELLASHGDNNTLSKGRSNRENTKICNFGMTSQLMHRLAPALAVYYQLQTL